MDQLTPQPHDKDRIARQEAARRIQNYDIDKEQKAKCINQLLVQAKYRNFDTEFDLNLLLTKMNIFNMTFEQAAEFGKEDREFKIQQIVDKAKLEAKLEAKAKAKAKDLEVKYQQFQSALRFISNGIEENFVFINLFNSNQILWNEFLVWRNQQE